MATAKPASDTAARVREALIWLERKGTKKTRESLSRYGIEAKNVLGVSMGNVQALGRKLGQDQALAIALWKTGCYEARHLTAFVADPGATTAAQMDRWTRQFDNWAVCDTLCFKLFDRTPHAWRKVEQWAARKEEFVKRAAFALLASLALHDKNAGDAQFLATLPLIERAATDDRNFVKKGVSWALRAIGTRNGPLHTASIATAERLAQSSDATVRWIGRDALRDLTRPLVRRRIAARQRSVKAAAATRS